MDVNKKARNTMIWLLSCALIALGSATVSILGIIFWWDILSAVFGGAAVIMLVITFKLRTRLLVYNMQKQYDKMYFDRAKPIKVSKPLLTSDWILKVEEAQLLKLYKNNELYRISYATIQGLRKRKRDLTLVAVAFIKDCSIEFDNAHLTKDLADLEKKAVKVEKCKHRIIITIKPGTYAIEELKLANKIHFMYHRTVNFVMINAIYNKSDKSVYFLHSDNYAPTAYYLMGCNIMKQIINV